LRFALCRLAVSAALLRLFAGSIQRERCSDVPTPHTYTHAPHTQEDVLYALSEGDALADLGLNSSSGRATAALSPASRSEMLYLLNDEGGSTPTLAYLRSVYNPPGQARSQWANFVERVKDLAVAKGITGLPKVVEEVSGAGVEVERRQG
jgi:hypothetical protein